MLTNQKGILFAALSALLVTTTVQAGTITYTTALSGAAESPATASAGTGTSTVIYDDVAHTMRVIASFSGLNGNTTSSHIHCCTATPGVSTAGVATQTPTFAGFPLGVTSGSFDNTFDLTLASSWNAAFITANGGTTTSAEAALLAGLDAGKAYFNIHTTAFPGGEIRGFLTATPEPSTAVLLLVPALAFWVRRRRGAQV